MSILLNDEALCCGARRLAVQLAAALPAPEDGFSPAFQADMTALTRCMIPDGLAAHINLGSWPVLPIFDVLEKAGEIDHMEMFNIFNMGIGMVLAVSPVARAAVSRWFVQITELVTAYRITPADAGDTVQDYTPTAPLGYVLSGDFTGRENGIRVMRWTSSQGDLLFEAVPMTGDEPISVELRSSSTGGLSSTETGQRPTGGAGEPEDYETENVTVHGLSAQLYRILPAEGTSPQVQHGCGLWFYRGSDPVHFHQVSIPEGAAALVWVDERANCLFLLIGGQSRQELVSVAESIYESERS